MLRAPSICLVLTCLWSCGGTANRPRRAPAATPLFTSSKVMVPMRDGTRLETAIFTPRDADRPLPMLFTRTPYGLPALSGAVEAWYQPLRADGYILVTQNLRGRFGSEGTFVMDRPPGTIDETTDAYDSIDWLVHNVPNNNGRVGMTGGSYSAWIAMLALREPHPALAVIAAAASPADQFIGDDMHHNGALRLSYAFEYSVLLSEKERNTDFEFDRADSYEWYLALGSLSNVNDRYLHGRAPSWNDLVAHPNRDAFWTRTNMDALLTRATVPVLTIAGFWDQEDFYGPQHIYELLEQHDTTHTNHIVIGPWNHGGWSTPGRTLAGVDFGSNTGTYYREHMQAPWLARWLHDKPSSMPDAQIFVSGRNAWESFDHWPPTGTTTTKLYLHADHSLSFALPESSTDYDEFLSDPNDPVPYTKRPIRAMTHPESDWAVWQASDQRFLGERPDVLSYRSDVLDQDLTVIGDIQAELFASTTGTDCDWIIKLIDVGPDGYQLMIAGDIIRARFRESLEHPTPVTANAVTQYTVPLRAHAHTFLRGHRIMVQIQSSWFPLYDRNPQHFTPSIFDAKDFVKATQRVYRSSSILLPLRVTGQTR